MFDKDAMIYMTTLEVNFDKNLGNQTKHQGVILDHILLSPLVQMCNIH